MLRSRTFAWTAMIAAATMLGAGIAVAAGTSAPPPRAAFVANAYVAADALAAGPAAGRLGAPIFTTAQESLSDSAKVGLTAYAPELVIVVGGTAAIADSVLTEISTATGLAIQPAGDAASSGIIRVFGTERTETAQKIAELFSAYDPAFLPADGKAYDADLLDGKDSSDFQPAGDYALADQSCITGQIVTGIAADGTPTCATDAVDGGDADLLDGKDSTEFAGAAALTTEVLGRRDGLARLVDSLRTDCGTPTSNQQGIDLAFCDLDGYGGGGTSANWATGDATAASFFGAMLYDSGSGEFGGSNLGSMSFALTDLRGADLRYANMPGVDLSFARMDGALLSNANLAGVTWYYTTCPDGTNSATNGTDPQSCTGHL